jgi:pimeloyl-ACP methyl ester carboxylesterase
VQALRLTIGVFCCCAISACAFRQEVPAELTLSNAASLPTADISVEIPSLRNCTHADNPRLSLNSEQPVIVIVHGCFSSAGQFRSLADVFAFHGQQAVCFSYDDRDSLTESSAELIAAIETLAAQLRRPEIAVLGHSQGGLVARRALIEERADRLRASGAVIDLTTISAPFNGIEAAAHCGSKALVWLSLGLVRPVCRLITGKKYRDIPPNSAFITQPGRLLPNVERHLRVVTDESGSCREYNDRGRCIEDDFVFSLDEQYQRAIDADPGPESVRVKSGHVEIVGDGNSTPTKLIGILQQQGVLNPTSPAAREDLARLLARIYPSPSLPN